MLAVTDRTGSGAAERPPLPRRATIRDVALAASVSPSTASRAVTGNGYVAPAVRARVLQAAQSLGYVPNASAQHLRRRVSRTLGVVVFDLANSFYAGLVAGAATEARLRGYSTVLTHAGADAADATEPVRPLVELGVAGVLLTPYSAETGSHLRRHRIATVEVDRQFADGVSDAVVVDNTAAAFRVTSQLTNLGHRRIALLIDEARWTTGRDRETGYQIALQHAGLPVDPSLVVSAGWKVAEATGAARRVLAGEPRPTAFVAASNVLAEGAWRAASELGLRIPEDLSLVAFDDAPWMSMVRPGVTVIAQDVAGLGRTAVEVLLARLRDPDAEVRTVVVPYQLIQRGSTGPVPARARAVSASAEARR